MDKQTLIKVHLFLHTNFNKTDIMKKFILTGFLLLGLSLFSQNQPKLNISETEKQEIINELEEMKTSFYSKVKSKGSQNLSASDKTELVQLYSEHKKKWNNTINLLSKKYNTDAKFILDIYKQGELKMNCKH
jgi:hypothetical protein